MNDLDSVTLLAVGFLFGSAPLLLLALGVWLLHKYNRRRSDEKTE